MSVVLLAGEGRSTRLVHHALAERFGAVTVIEEPRTSQWALLKRRRRTLGTRTVVGQALFVALVLPLLRRRSAARSEAILREHGLVDAPMPTVHRVSSVNTEETRALLRRLAPSVVVVNGTRIIGRETLHCVDVPFVNMHAGITPAYRGVHGGWWALAEGRPDLVGTTVHYLDEGIDTGSIIAQVPFAVTPADDFTTYPLLHAAAGLPALVDAVARIVDGAPPPRRTRDDLPSRLRSHPTVWGYLRAGVK